MNLKQLEYMTAIADERNITKAADRLFLTQSALNQQLLKLEKELGTPLFSVPEMSVSRLRPGKST